MAEDREPLVVPQDEFEVVRKVAEETGLAKPLADTQLKLRLRIAEAKLAALRGLCVTKPDRVCAEDVLRIIGSEEGP